MQYQQNNTNSQADNPNQDDIIMYNPESLYNNDE